LFGINLGAARVVKNMMVGEGIDDARRIMSFANPNQILVSHVYYEMAAKLTQEISQMFEKYEMHAHEHDVYAVRLLKEAAAEDAAAEGAIAGQSFLAKINWMYVAYGLLALLGFAALGKLVTAPTAPATAQVQSVEASKQTQSEQKKAKVAQKKAKQKAATEAKANTSSAPKPAESPAEKPAETNSEKNISSNKSGWDSVKESIKQGAEHKCTQAEIAMSQCK
jgi:hypothetical protein